MPSAKALFAQHEKKLQQIKQRKKKKRHQRKVKVAIRKAEQKNDPDAETNRIRQQILDDSRKKKSNRNSNNNKPSATFVKTKSAKIRDKKKHLVNPLALVDETTFESALQNLNNTKRKRDNFEEEYDAEEFSSFGLKRSAQDEDSTSNKKRRINEDENHISTKPPSKSTKQSNLYGNSFLATLLASDKPVFTKGSVELPSNSEQNEEEQDQQNNTTDNWDLTSQLDQYNSIYLDGDALAYLAAKMLEDDSIRVIYPVLEYTILNLLQEWLEKNDRFAKDHIVFRSSVQLSAPGILREFPDTFAANAAVVGASRIDIGGNYDVKFFRASQFLKHEITLHKIRSTLSSLKQGYFSTAFAPDRNEQRLISFLSTDIHKNTNAYAFSRNDQPVECLLDFKDSILFYDAYNLINNMSPQTSLPQALHSWCVFMLIRLFAKKYGVKKTVIVLDVNPVKGLKSLDFFEEDESIEVIVAPKGQKADEVIVQESKKYDISREQVILVTEDVELSWRASRMVECKVEAWKQAALSLFHFKLRNSLSLVEKAYHDVLLWYIQQDTSVSSGEWNLRRMEDVDDRRWMQDKIQGFMQQFDMLEEAEE